VQRHCRAHGSGRRGNSSMVQQRIKASCSRCPSSPCRQTRRRASERRTRHRARTLTNNIDVAGREMSRRTTTSQHISRQSTGRKGGREGARPTRVLRLDRSCSLLTSVSAVSCTLALGILAKYCLVGAELGEYTWLAGRGPRLEQQHQSTPTTHP
jgi:hypothetical protein